ncbi:rhamnogalacturonan lyase B N-terminal domain-containing protein [Eleftheria terrae]|uniref:rhamnogalacturonan lyase B N-terminal domain-containing protein n=1 Tax=Eleftheria terrae TaxID=1597781 RepID=UPI00263A487C|nr:rhamnogalacturonan lyase B N-terminal domain-containing protein [Eleftheria terrae]WKB55600.1 polysaccharide lyase family protein [Eleftheria terrae]
MSASLLLCATLAACGGGSSDTTGASAETATATVPAPASGGAAAAPAERVDDAAADAFLAQTEPALHAATTSADASALAGFSLQADDNFYTVDTGAGLVFKVRRRDNGVSTQSPGDIASLVYKGVQYQDASRGSQLNSGFDYLYNGVSAVQVDALQLDADHIRVTVQAGPLTHYYLARRGQPHIYMATHFTREPDTLNLARFILRVPVGVLPNGPEASDIRGNVGAIEASDIFGMPNGETRSKHYSNMRLKDWRHIGATGPQAGLWIVRDNNEGNSGGPFYRSLLNQGTDRNQELTYIINYGEAQTEAFRTGILNAYTLAFTDGSAPGAIDTAWLAGMGLKGYVGAAGRGGVAGVGIAGRDARHGYTVGFSSPAAQYWADVVGEKGHYRATGMLPGTYTMTVYKNELAVDTRTVTVSPGRTTVLHTLTPAGDPAKEPALWRIGDWDGTPLELLNGDKLTRMHPSDIRMAPWSVPPYVVGLSKAATGFPAAQWKSVNGAVSVRFKLTREQLGSYTLRAGITTAHSGGRPVVQVNQWTSPVPAASAQPKTRMLTVGTYRGNNTLYSYTIPASALVVGDNVLTLRVASGSSGERFLSPGFAYDAIDLVRAR